MITESTLTYFEKSHDKMGNNVETDMNAQQFDFELKFHGYHIISLCGFVFIETTLHNNLDLISTNDRAHKTYHIL